jgi:hypothetical protein
MEKRRMRLTDDAVAGVADVFLFRAASRAPKEERVNNACGHPNRRICKDK